DCIGWLDPHNNKAFLTSQISATNNAMSIMISAKRDLPDMGKVIDHALNPKGPKGRFHSFVPVTHGIFSHTPDPAAAKHFLRWLMDPKQVAAWYRSAQMYHAPFLHAYDKDEEWNKEPRFKPYQKVLETGKLVSWPATFVGLGNFVNLWNDAIFWQAVWNTFRFTAAATVLKLVGGLGMALVMHQNFKLKGMTRALLLLPFIVPTVLSTVAWQWI